MSEAEAHFDEHLGDLITLVPIVASDFGRTIDTTREPLEVVVLTNYVAPSASDVGHMEARLAYEETEAEIRRANLPAGGFKFRKEDEVIFGEYPGEPRFKISRVDDVDPDRIFLTLARLANGST
jgi:hypothetical protein